MPADASALDQGGIHPEACGLRVEGVCLADQYQAAALLIPVCRGQRRAATNQLEQQRLAGFFMKAQETLGPNDARLGPDQCRRRGDRVPDLGPAADGGR